MTNVSTISPLLFIQFVVNCMEYTNKLPLLKLSKQNDANFNLDKKIKQTTESNYCNITILYWVG